MESPRQKPEGLSVILPCLNEAETVAAAVAEARAGAAQLAIPFEIVVADNGSTDATREIAEKAGARVEPIPHRGYGAALDGGISRAQYRWVAFADSDLSYPFLEIPKLLRPLLEGKADFVLGSRLRGTIERGAMPILNRLLGTPVLSALIRRLYRLPVSDCNSGMRALDANRYRELRLRCPGMEYASEMLIRVSQHKLRYQEVPISFRKDQRSRKPHLRPWRDGWRHLRFILGNATSRAVLVVPAVISALLLIVAFVLSLSQLWDPDGLVHYHTAFVCIAMAVPPLMLIISLLLVKMALHSSGQVSSEAVVFVEKMSEQSVTLLFTGVFMLLVLAQTGVLVYQWYLNGFGHLYEMGAVIRITIFALATAVTLAFDIGLGLLRLVPYKPLENE